MAGPMKVDCPENFVAAPQKNISQFAQTFLLALMSISVAACSGGGSGGGDSGSDGSGLTRSPSSIETPAEIAIFESGQVRPLALSPDSDRLYAVNTPDNRLEIFDLTSGTPVISTSIPVGMEPVSVSLDPNGFAWVVNHLSDSVSVVDTDANAVTQTLHVGDEPRDIVFANGKAFITTAHRGQNAPFDPELTVPGIGRADVWVFDINSLGDTLGGTPLTIVNLFSDIPRSLAVSPDNKTVYASAFHSGNQTTALFADAATGGLDKAPPLENIEGITAPDTGLIVRFNGTDWVDHGNPIIGVAGKVWTDKVPFSLPDLDVFEIDAEAATPALVAQHASVGTTLFNMVTNPATGALYISNTEARNEVRFEGHSNVSTSVRGDMVRTRISVLQNGTITHRNLNKHITSYADDLGTPEENALSTSQVLQMAVSADGGDIYAVSFGNNKILRYSTSDLEDDLFVPSSSTQTTLTGGGPTGIVLDEARDQAYVLTRFDNGISVIDTNDLSETAHITMFNPEPDHVIQGRPFLYDAGISSSRGDHSCGSCHVFGDADQLAWDLGEPDGVVKENPNEYEISLTSIPQFHPMKGPMTTQSLRGLAGNGPMHWRGDRTGVSADADETLEEQAFEDFNPAFEGLLGRDGELDESQMDLFAKFALELTYPPNPIRNLDNSLTAEQQDGRNTYLNVRTTGGGLIACNQCHVLNVEENDFGTAGKMSVEGPNTAEDFKIPHLRNVYTKVGRFHGESTEPQIRGFGFLHDGAIDTLDTFFGQNTNGTTLGQNIDVTSLGQNIDVTTLAEIISGSQSPGSTSFGQGFVFDSPEKKANVIDFVFAMDSELAPIVGQQVTLNAETAENQNTLDRIAMMVERASVIEPREECDLVALGLLNGEQRGAFLNVTGEFLSDKIEEDEISVNALQSMASEKGNTLTFMCVPPGQGRRIALDRDADEFFNADEIAAGSDPADAASIPQ